MAQLGFKEVGIQWKLLLRCWAMASRNCQCRVETPRGLQYSFASKLTDFRTLGFSEALYFASRFQVGFLESLARVGGIHQNVDQNLWFGIQSKWRLVLHLTEMFTADWSTDNCGKQPPALHRRKLARPCRGCPIRRSKLDYFTEQWSQRWRQIEDKTLRNGSTIYYNCWPIGARFETHQISLQRPIVCSVSIVWRINSLLKHRFVIALFWNSPRHEYFSFEQKIRVHG